VKPPVISIIDDDEEVRDAVEGLTRSLGYKAVTFGSAEQFLLSDCAWTSSCIITDLQMPGMSGIELQERLAIDGNRTPIIFMTAFVDDAAWVRARGVVGLLTKPFDDKSLGRRLEEALAESEK
jgi:FixJ family two-component response regulator